MLELHFNSLLQLCSPESLELGRDVDCKIVVAVAAQVSGCGSVAKLAYR